MFSMKILSVAISPVFPLQWDHGVGDGGEIQNIWILATLMYVYLLYKATLK